MPSITLHDLATSPQEEIEAVCQRVAQGSPWLAYAGLLVP
jgi:hypothetical protein